MTTRCQPFRAPFQQYNLFRLSRYPQFLVQAESANIATQAKTGSSYNIAFNNKVFLLFSFYFPHRTSKAEQFYILNFVLTSKAIAFIRYTLFKLTMTFTIATFNESLIVGQHAYWPPSQQRLKRNSPQCLKQKSWRSNISGNMVMKLFDQPFLSLVDCFRGSRVLLVQGRRS